MYVRWIEESDSEINSNNDTNTTNETNTTTTEEEEEFINYMFEGENSKRPTGY